MPILFPSGATWVKLEEGHYTFLHRELSGIDAESAEYKRLDPVEFIYPIIPHKLFKILDNHFGLNPDKERTEYYRWGDNKILYPFQNIPEEDLEETREWIRRRLTRAGCRTDNLKVSLIRSRIRKNSNQLTDSEVINEKVFHLGG